MKHFHHEKEMNFDEMVMRGEYERVKGLGDRLPFLKDMVDWNQFIPMVRLVFHDNDEVGGRPHTNEIVVVRAMILQSLYGLSDEELEFQCNDRLSFRNFLDYPEKVPDFTTIWKIRERLHKACIDNLIWDELQRQLIAKGYTIKKGVIQDATFIESDQGKKRIQEEKKAKKEGKEIEYTEKQKAHLDKDASFAIKGNNIHHGYKDHIKMDIDYQLIRDIKITTAKVPDNDVNLVTRKDVAAYRDRGYFVGNLPKGVVDNTMLRATRGHKLNGGQLKRNSALSRIRSIGERPFSVIKSVFHGGRTTVKTLERVRIKETFKGFAFNLYQMFTLEKKRLGRAIDG
jgi:IS5 family transposase